MEYGASTEITAKTPINFVTFMNKFGKGLQLPNGFSEIYITSDSELSAFEWHTLIQSYMDSYNENKFMDK